MKQVTKEEWEQIEGVLRKLREKYGPEFADAVGQIVWRNVDKGRMRSFIRSGAVSDAGAYAQRVARYYRKEAEYVYAIQDDRDDELWGELFVLMQKWAYGMLSRRHFLDPEARFEQGQACAAEAGVVICRKFFPFDTDFERWACRVVGYTCANYLRKQRRGSSVPWHLEDSFDAPNAPSQWLRDDDAQTERERIEQRLDMMRHITALAEAQQQFIILHYLEQRSYEELATLMGRNKNALYKLNFDALANLRKKMTLPQHNYE